MKRYYTPQARNDLMEIREYISQNLQNPIAAKNVTSKILKTASLLGEQPRLGISVAEKTGRETDILCLFCGNYGIFYKITDKGILVLRILDARTDYMRFVLTAEPEPEEKNKLGKFVG